MMYPYMTLEDKTEIVHSQIIEGEDGDHVEVHFERPAHGDFDSARCVLPEYRWKFREGYSDEEIAFFEELLRHNAHLFFKFARSGGIQCA